MKCERGPGRLPPNNTLEPTAASVPLAVPSLLRSSAAAHSGRYAPVPVIRRLKLIDSRFPMLEALYAAGPAPDRARQMMLYGRFVGSWEGRFVYHAPDG